MDPIELLMAEHRLIERGLGALEIYAGRVQTDTDDSREELSRFVDFLRGFADTHHHLKEEDILFECMREAGFPKDTGPVAVMLAEHVEGRAFVSELKELAEAAEPWGAAERRRIALSARGFVQLLRAHIMKEDQVLYPMARQALPPGLQETMAEAFGAHEDEHGEEGARLSRLGEELATRWFEA